MSYVKQNRNFRYTPCWRAVIGMDSGLETGSSGLCYYSFDNGKLHELSNRETGTGREVAEVHSIFEKATVSFIWRLRVKVLYK